MEPTELIVIISITMIASAIIGAFLAAIKNRCADRWGFFCFLFPPLILVLLFLPKSTQSKSKKISRKDFDEEMREYFD